MWAAAVRRWAATPWLPEPYAERAVTSPVHLASPGIGGDHELSRVCSNELRGQYVEAADATQLQAQHVTEHLRSDDTDPQPVNGPGPAPTTSWSSSASPYPGDIETLRDQRHELLDMSHLVSDGRGGEHTLSAGQANVDHCRGVQREHQRRFSHDHHRAAR